jgi:predicted Zn finger-like uncharacterized protein
MAIQCRCTTCGTRYQVGDELAGRKVRCKKCDKAFDVPAAKAQATAVTNPFDLTDLGEAQQPEAMPAAAYAAQRPRKKRGRKALETWQVAAIGGVLLVAGVGVVLALFGIASKGSSEPASFVLELPESLRKEVTLAVDGEGKELSPKGALNYSLTPGEHNVEIARRGQVIKHHVSLEPGQTVYYAPKFQEIATTDGTSPPAGPDPFLILNWPPEERIGAEVTIDGAQTVFPPMAEIRIPLRARPYFYDIVLSRPGYEPIKLKYMAVAGESIPPYDVKWKGAAKPPEGEGGLALDGWLQDFETAKRNAARDRKNILVFFSGSDWDQWSVLWA